MTNQTKFKKEFLTAQAAIFVMLLFFLGCATNGSILNNLFDGSQSVNDILMKCVVFFLVVLALIFIGFVLWPNFSNLVNRLRSHPGKKLKADDSYPWGDDSYPVSDYTKRPGQSSTAATTEPRVTKTGQVEKRPIKYETNDEIMEINKNYHKLYEFVVNQYKVVEGHAKQLHDLGEALEQINTDSQRYVTENDIKSVHDKLQSDVEALKKQLTECRRKADLLESAKMEDLERRISALEDDRWSAVRSEIDTARSDLERARRKISESVTPMASAVIGAIQVASSQDRHLDLQDFRKGAMRLLGEIENRVEFISLGSYISLQRQLTNLLMESNTIESEMRSETSAIELSNARRRLRDIVKQSQALATQSPQQAEFTDSENGFIAEMRTRLIREIDRVYCSILQGRVASVHLDLLSRLMQNIGLEIIPIEIGYTLPDSRLHKVNEKRVNTNYQPGTICEVIRMGYKDTSSGNTVAAEVNIARAD